MRFLPQLVKDWEVIDDLQAEIQAGGESPQDMSAPGICEGYLLKRRKWPLKGWHKVRNHTPTSHSPTPFLWLMGSGHCLPFFSDTLSWKLGSCATPRVSTMSVNLPFHRRNSHFLLNKKNMYRIQVLRGRVQGSLDVSHAVMAVNKKSYRIDLDAGDILYHMKVNVYRLIFKQFPASRNVV